MANPVVTSQQIDQGIVQITMQDRASKNTFSPALIDGLVDAFETVKRDAACRVVILTGYDNYFASGGTQESLIQLSEGKGTFADVAGGQRGAGSNLYSLALDCAVPVISSMQGHGIGGGFVMGLFADFVVLSRESIYTTNFMKYGFTPGMGATAILPAKLGLVLAQEMLMTAKSFYGEELQKRGISFPVLPRAEVVSYALELARSLAEKPRVALVALKERLVADIRRNLPSAIEQELAMHQKTFTQPEVRERIKALFHN
jgi:polyketide biosynthesis enoyl-CoA hydratase PksI